MSVLPFILCLVLFVALYYYNRFLIVASVVVLAYLFTGYPRVLPVASGEIISHHISGETVIYLWLLDDDTSTPFYVIVPYTKELSEKLSSEEHRTGRLKFKFENSLDLEEPTIREMPFPDLDLKQPQTEKPLNGQGA